MSDHFKSTKFFLALFLMLIASIFVVLRIGTFDAWAYYTTGILGIYSGANVANKYLQK